MVDSRPVPGWIASYRSGDIDLEELGELIANHKFAPSPKLERSYREKLGPAYMDGDGEASDVESGTYDDVTLGDLTPAELIALSKRVWRDVNR